MYRDLGFDPDPALTDDGIFDLICGRPYCNLGREPRMQYKNMPFEHSFARLKKNPSLALYPQAMLNPRKAGPAFFIKIPLLFFKMWWSEIKQHQTIQTFADQFAQEILPPYLAEVEKAQNEDWRRLSAKEVLDRYSIAPLNVVVMRPLATFLECRTSSLPTVAPNGGAHRRADQR